MPGSGPGSAYCPCRACCPYYPSRPAAICRDMIVVSS